jgi:hypothetical protein
MRPVPPTSRVAAPAGFRLGVFPSGGCLRWSSLGLLLTLAACGTPAVLRGPPDAASMETPTTLPMPAIAEPTGEPPITLQPPTPPAAPQSDLAAMP